MILRRGQVLYEALWPLCFFSSTAHRSYYRMRQELRWYVIQCELWGVRTLKERTDVEVDRRGFEIEDGDVELKHLWLLPAVVPRFDLVQFLEKLN